VSLRTPRERANAPLIVTAALTIALGIGPARAQSDQMVIAHPLPED
jgi:hypothetical protein